MFIGSVASAGDLHLKVEDLPFSLDTGPRRTTGLGGALFGHLSDADVNQVLAGAAAKLEASSPGKWVRLPLSLEMSINESRPVSVSHTGMFGTEKVHQYQSFGAEGAVKVPVLSAMPLEGSERVGSVKFVVRYNGIKAAELDLSPADLLNSETSFPYDKYGHMTLNLPARLRYELGAKLRKINLRDDIEDVSLNLEFEMADRPYNKYEEVAIQRWRKYQVSNFAGLFYVSKSRFFKPSYYSALCSNLLRGG